MREGCVGSTPSSCTKVKKCGCWSNSASEIRHQRSAPAFRPVRPVARLVAVEDGLLRQRVLQFFIRPRYRHSLFPGVLRTPQTDRDLQAPVEQTLHHEARSADLVPRVERARATATRVRHKVDDYIHTHKRHQLTMVPGMPRLTAGLATLHATPPHAVVTRETIRGGRFGGSGGILLPVCEFTFEIGDPLRVLGELFAKPSDLVRLAITDVARLTGASRSLFPLRLHQSERIESV